MGFESNGRPRAVDARPNVFALVIYIPDPLGAFLDDLRRELVPGCNPHAHVSVLPPRPLSVDWQTASEEARILAGGWMPFDVELTNVEIFPGTEVIYLEVGAGMPELRGMHAAMNNHALEFREPYPYQPHITLAQEIEHKEVPRLYELAIQRWREFRGPRTFRAERAVFVQNTHESVWVDLASYSFGPVAVR